MQMGEAMRRGLQKIFFAPAAARNMGVRVNLTGACNRRMCFLTFSMVLVLCIVPFLLSACVSRREAPAQMRQVEFSAADKGDLPPVLENMIHEKEKKPFRITYRDKGILYIAEGYGRQPTTGYHVEVQKLYATETEICFRSQLEGPKENEETEETPSYPYIVIKLQENEKEVLFI